jgi:hypothetical protein
MLTKSILLTSGKHIEIPARHQLADEHDNDLPQEHLLKNCCLDTAQRKLYTYAI